MFDPTYAPLKDAPKTPTIEVPGNTIYLTRKDPYGHVYLSLAKGELPAKFAGAYTTMAQAEFAANKYTIEREEAMKDIVEETKVPRKKKNA